MLAFVETYSFKCAQLQQAIRSGDDGLVRLLDREIEPLVATILAHGAGNAFEIYVQLQFVNSLILAAGDDRSSVSRYAAALAVLLDRYFPSIVADAGMPDALPDGRRPNVQPRPADDSLLNEVILDSLPDRVAVVTRDYRYLYSNPVNCAHLGKSKFELVGRHVMEFVGPQRFMERAKPRLDRCFAGEASDYLYDRQGEGGATETIRCRMTPLRGSNEEVVGATIHLHEACLTASVLAA